MLLSNSSKFFVGFTLLFASSCGYWQGNSNAASSAANFAVEETKTGIPFASKEPDVYQAEIVLTNYSGGEKTEHKIFTARNGERLRSDYENKISFLQTSESEKFLIHNGRKVYAETSINSNVSNESSETIKDFLTTEWLNEKRAAKFEKLGAENNLTKYLVTLEDAANADSETLIYVDENLKIPVKQEFYTTNGGQKILTFSMELRNLNFETDNIFFQLPKDYRKVSAAEFRKLTNQGKLTEWMK